MGVPALIKSAGLSSADCVEKSDLRARCREAQERLAEAERPPAPRPAPRSRLGSSKTASDGISSRGDVKPTPFGECRRVQTVSAARRRFPSPIRARGAPPAAARPRAAIAATACIRRATPLCTAWKSTFHSLGLGLHVARALVRPLARVPRGRYLSIAFLRIGRRRQLLHAVLQIVPGVRIQGVRLDGPLLDARKNFGGSGFLYSFSLRSSRSPGSTQIAPHLSGSPVHSWAPRWMGRHRPVPRIIITRAISWLRVPTLV